MRVIITLFVLFLSLASFSFGQEASSSSCPSDVATNECVCLRLGKYYAVGGFFDGCNSCECRQDGTAICTQQICPIIPTETPSTTSIAPATCLLSNFSDCSGGITPCAYIDCMRTLECVPHRCNTEDNRCSAFCSCRTDSDCAFNNGQCVQNEFGINICKAAPEPASCNYYGRVFADGESFSEINGCNQCSCVNGNVVCTKKFCPCPANKPQVQCLINPCQTAQCKLGNDLCLSDYCGGCNAKCRCEHADDCSANEKCQVDASGWSFCVPKTTTAPPTTAPPTRRCYTKFDCNRGEICQYSLLNPFWGKCVVAPTTAPTTTSCAGRVCPAILCANRPRECRYKCSINYCSCSDYCECRNNNDCYNDERCSSGKCVSK